MRIRIEGSDLPGRRGGAEAHTLRLRGVQVGVQRTGPGRLVEVADRVPADAESARWELTVTSREVDGLLDVGGPWVHGRPGTRFLYLSWGAVEAEQFAGFRRAKLMFGDVPGDLLRAAHESDATLVGRLGLTDALGEPRSARVRPPDIAWSLA